MRSSKLAAIMAAAILWALSFTTTASAQRYYRGREVDIIDAGTNITVRTNERIRATDGDGRVFSGVVAEDVRDRRGDIIIPRGSDVELMVRQLGNNDFVVDLDSVRINGERYGLDTESNVVEGNGGLAPDRRTGEYAGAGAVLGAIVGAIGGGGKGAAIGAGAGAAAGAGAEVLTRGRSINVPADSLLTFRLAEPLRAGVADNGYARDGLHYHQGYRGDRYESQQAREKPGPNNSGRGTIHIGNDHNVTWQGSESGNVYVQMDNQPPKLFASGQSGAQPAPWIMPGHLYVFTFKDANGNVIASDQMDLRK